MLRKRRWNAWIIVISLFRLILKWYFLQWKKDQALQKWKSSKKSKEIECVGPLHLRSTWNMCDHSESQNATRRGSRDGKRKVCVTFFQLSWKSIVCQYTNLQISPHSQCFGLWYFLPIIYDDDRMWQSHHGVAAWLCLPGTMWCVSAVLGASWGWILNSLYPVLYKVFRGFVQI